MIANDCNPLGLVLRKLERGTPMNESDRAAILSMPLRIAAQAAGSHLVREGDRNPDCCILLAGYACRYKLATDGGRQIVAFHIPGDMLDLQQLLLPRADHSLLAITKVTVGWVAQSVLLDLLHSRPGINDALWRDTLVDASIFREWVLNVGRRDAKARIAHMLCEFAARREAAGLGSATEFELPMTQEHIADATGITPIHVNRMLQALAEDGVIDRDRRHIRIADWDRMRRAAGFDSAYLHFAA